MIKKPFAEQIREMTEFFEAEDISKAIGLSVELVEGLLSGEILDEVVNNYDPSRPPEIRVVKKNNIVRSRSVGVISTGGCGGTTLTSILASLYALKTQNKTAVLDLNEYPSTGLMLGVDPFSADCIFYPDVFSERNLDMGSQAIPCNIPNLDIYYGPLTLDSYNEKTSDDFIKVVHDISSIYTSIFTRCPNSPALWPKILPTMDMILLVTRQDVSAIAGLLKILAFLKKLNLEGKTMMFLNFGGMKDSISSSEFRRLIRQNSDAQIFDLPYERTLAQYSPGTCYVEREDSPFIKAAEEVLHKIYPGLIPVEQSKGFLKTIGDFFKS